MGFPKEVSDEALVRCGRCCCICHLFCGTKIESHHIKQKVYGGEDTLDNCIPLCLNCHADMGKADPKHPKGKHYTEEELRGHRDQWYKIVASGIVLQRRYEEKPVVISISELDIRLDIPEVSDGYGGFLHGSYCSFSMEIINRSSSDLVLENLHCTAYSKGKIISDKIPCLNKDDYEIVALSRNYKRIGTVSIRANDVKPFDIKLQLSGDFSTCDRINLEYNLSDVICTETIFLKREDSSNA
ncbi:MAG: HNH endonuclease [Acidaminococcaceae bacterium]|nr:HNH endonuclease [Acidaminococcaceae bacterium]